MIKVIDIDGQSGWQKQYLDPDKEPKLWTDEQIDEFCGFKDNTDNNSYKIDLNSSQVKVEIILLTLVVIFMFSTIILSVRLKRQNKKFKEYKESKENISKFSMVELLNE